MSRAVHAFGDEELAAILEASRRNNSRNGLTGILVHIRRHFFQLLEGPPDAVETTFSRIAADPRHHDVIKLRDLSITERHFPAWTMGFPSLNAGQLARLDGYSDLGSSGSQDLARLRSHASDVYTLMVSIAKA